MRFMMMIKSDARTEAGLLPEPAVLAAMGAFNEELAAAGALLGGEGLQASAKGARVRLRDGKFAVTDGPFAEAKELIAGFWLLRAPSLRDAVAWAERVPAEDCELELRRLWEMSDFAPPEASAPAGDDWRAFEGRFREEHGQGEAAGRADAPAPGAPPRRPGTTRFLLMLRSDRATESGAPPPEAAMNRMGALMEELGGSGALLGGEGLRPSREGARVRGAGGKRAVVDGPFSESKELIAGYLLLQVPALADAIAVAKRWLSIHVETAVDCRGAEIEIRQLFEATDFPAEPADLAAREARLRAYLEGRTT